MIPKIEFRYSWIYDERYRQKAKTKYPSPETIIKYKNKIEAIWKKQEKKILTEIAKLTKYTWKEKEIICYIIGRTRCFSDPLTMCVIEDKKWFMDLLTHELIHRIQTKNTKKNEKWKKYLEKKYPKESKTTRNHIITHAVHHEIYLKTSNRKGLNNDIEVSKKHRDYERAWEIVQEEGAQEIIKKFREVTA